MVITAIQAILISFLIGMVVGGIIGWKLTFNLRLAKVQEQQVTINKLVEENRSLRVKIRSHNIQKTKEKAGNAVVAVGNGVVSAGGAVGNAATGLKNKFWPNKDKKKLKSGDEK